jgi:hypothetical protein
MEDVMSDSNKVESSGNWKRIAWIILACLVVAAAWVLMIQHKNAKAIEACNKAWDAVCANQIVEPLNPYTAAQVLGEVEAGKLHGNQPVPFCGDDVASKIVTENGKRNLCACRCTLASKVVD